MTRKAVLGVLLVLTIVFNGASVFSYQFIFSDLGIAHRLSLIQGKLLLIQFSSPSCYYCRLFDEKTITNKDVQEFLRANYVYAKILPGSNKTTFMGKQYTNDGLFNAFGVRGVPTFIFMNGNSRVLEVPGYTEAPVFLKILRYALRSVENNLKEDWESYAKREDVFSGNPKIITVSKADAEYVLKYDKNAVSVSKMPPSVDIGKVYVTSDQSLANELSKAGVIRVLLVK